MLNSTASFNSFDDPEPRVVTGVKLIISAQVPEPGSDVLEVRSLSPEVGWIAQSRKPQRSVAESATDAVYEVTPSGIQSTVSTGLDVPNGVALDGLGNLYVADTFNELVTKIDRADAPAFEFEPTKINSTSQDSPETVEIENIGGDINVAGRIYRDGRRTDQPAPHHRLGAACVILNTAGRSGGGCDRQCLRGRYLRCNVLL